MERTLDQICSDVEDLTKSYAKEAGEAQAAAVSRAYELCCNLLKDDYDEDDLAAFVAMQTKHEILAEVVQNLDLVLMDLEQAAINESEKGEE